MTTNSFEKRKVLNTKEVILAAKQLNLKYQEIARICNVSKTMVSHWGNATNKQQATYNQIKPLLKHVGVGRIEVKLEPLSPAAIERSRGSGIVFIGVYIMIFFGIMWFFAWKPCSNNWDQCKQLKWYQMPFYGSLEVKKHLEEYKENRLINNHNNKINEKAN